MSSDLYQGSPMNTAELRPSSALALREGESAQELLSLPAAELDPEAVETVLKTCKLEGTREVSMGGAAPPF